MKKKKIVWCAVIIVSFLACCIISVASKAKAPTEPPALETSTLDITADPSQGQTTTGGLTEEDLEQLSNYLKSKGYFMSEEQGDKLIAQAFADAKANGEIVSGKQVEAFFAAQQSQLGNDDRQSDQTVGDGTSGVAQSGDARHATTLANVTPGEEQTQTETRSITVGEYFKQACSSETGALNATRKSETTSLTFFDKESAVNQEVELYVLEGRLCVFVEDEPFTWQNKEAKSGDLNLGVCEKHNALRNFIEAKPLNAVKVTLTKDILDNFEKVICVWTGADGTEVYGVRICNDSHGKGKTREDSEPETPDPGERPATDKENERLEKVYPDRPETDAMPGPPAHSSDVTVTGEGAGTGKHGGHSSDGSIGNGSDGAMAPPLVVERWDGSPLSVE